MKQDFEKQVTDPKGGPNFSSDFEVPVPLVPAPCMAVMPNFLTKIAQKFKTTTPKF